MSRTYVIAEAGVNHNGDLERAFDLVECAAEAGADAVKFQTFDADRLVSSTAEKASYQKETTDRDESQYDMLEALEMSREDHSRIAAHCDRHDIQFLSTPYDVDSLHFLTDNFDLPYVKVPSAEIVNGMLLWHVAQTGVPIILSTGMSTLGEVEDALSVLAYGLLHTTPPSSLAECRRTYSGEDVQDTLQDRVVLLHCTSEYPAPVDTIQLRAMDTLRRAFDLRVGYSDHTEGIAVPTAAVARGAVMIEKHFTLDRSLPGPDHRASLEPDELTSMVASIRRTEAALGTGRKQPRGNEWGNRTAMRRSLVAARPISEGTVLTEDDVAIKRQGDGLSPMRYWEVLGTEARRDFAPDAPIAPQSVE